VQRARSLHGRDRRARDALLDSGTGTDMRRPAPRFVYAWAARWVPILTPGASASVISSVCRWDVLF
jgi:hypothetical protein